MIFYRNDCWAWCSYDVRWRIKRLSRIDFVQNNLFAQVNNKNVTDPSERSVRFEKHWKTRENVFVSRKSLFIVMDRVMKAIPVLNCQSIPIDIHRVVNSVPHHSRTATCLMHSIQFSLRSAFASVVNRFHSNDSYLRKCLSMIVCDFYRFWIHDQKSRKYECALLIRPVRQWNERKAKLRIRFSWHPGRPPYRPLSQQPYFHLFHFEEKERK